MHNTWLALPSPALQVILTIVSAIVIIVVGVVIVVCGSVIVIIVVGSYRHCQ